MKYLVDINSVKHLTYWLKKFNVVLLNCKKVEVVLNTFSEPSRFQVGNVIFYLPLFFLVTLLYHPDKSDKVGDDT